MNAFRYCIIRRIPSEALFVERVSRPFPTERMPEKGSSGFSGHSCGPPRPNPKVDHAGTEASAGGHGGHRGEFYVILGFQIFQSIAQHFQARRLLLILLSGSLAVFAEVNFFFMPFIRAQKDRFLGPPSG